VNNHINLLINKNKHPSIDRQVQKKGVVSCVFSLGGGQIYKFILNNKKKSRTGIRDLL
jgi:hypothetical protein